MKALLKASKTQKHAKEFFCSSFSKHISRRNLAAPSDVNKYPSLNYNHENSLVKAQLVYQCGVAVEPYPSLCKILYTNTVYQYCIPIFYYQPTNQQSKVKKMNNSFWFALVGIFWWNYFPEQKINFERIFWKHVVGPKIWCKSIWNHVYFSNAYNDKIFILPCSNQPILTYNCSTWDLTKLKEKKNW